MFKFKRENNRFQKAGELITVFAPTSRQQNHLDTHDHAEKNLQEISSQNTNRLKGATKIQNYFWKCHRKQNNVSIENSENFHHRFLT